MACAGGCSGPPAAMRDDEDEDYDPAEEGELEVPVPVVDEPFEDLLEGGDEELEEGEDEEEEGEEGLEEGAEAPAARPRRARTEEEEAPGPDIPAPPVKTLRKALERAFQGEDVTEELLDRFAQHAHILLDHNRRVNLTAILDPAEVAAQHYFDSWRLTQYYSFVGRRVVDLGSGGGFPGIPLALAEPNGSFVLIDSTRKKADFLQHCVQELGLRNTSVHWGRAEDWLAKERCDVVLIRAVSSVRENVRTLRKVRHSLKDLIMYKGPSWSREVRAGEREAERLGFHMDTVWEYRLPEDQGQRALLVYRAPGGQGI
jgi:16S rRNA (guanine527-N7)-methyltransferase